jgi:hypothetical protein
MNTQQNGIALNDDALEAIAGGGLKNALTFGMAGSQTGVLGGGVVGGPVGALIGGVIGGVGGLIGGALSKDDPKGDIHVMY